MCESENVCRRLFLRVVWSLGDPEDYVYVERGARTSDRLLVTRSSLLPVLCRPTEHRACYSLRTSTREPRVMCTTLHTHTYATVFTLPPSRRRFAPLSMGREGFRPT